MICLYLHAYKVILDAVNVCFGNIQKMNVYKYDY